MTDACRRTGVRPITGPQTKVNEIIRFDWPDPNIAKIRGAPTKSVRDIRCGKFYSPEK